MKTTHIILGLVGSVALFLPLSNILGLTTKNEPIVPEANTSPNFAKVSQIFQNKCVDCHSPGMTRMPIYADLPIAKQLMASDIENASARLQISKAMYSGGSAFTPLMLACAITPCLLPCICPCTGTIVSIRVKSRQF
jgi:cytochrome c peroxidase